MLRRTRATHIYQKGVELALVSRILGHADLDMTRIYAQPLLAMMRHGMSSFLIAQTEDGKPLWMGSPVFLDYRFHLAQSGEVGVHQLIAVVFACRFCTTRCRL